MILLLRIILIVSFRKPRASGDDPNIATSAAITNQ